MTERQNEIIADIRKATAGPDEIGELYESLKHFCYKIANQYSSLLRCPDEIADLLQEGYFAIMEAAASYDPEAGLNFLSYLAWYLRRAYEAYAGSSSGTSIGIVRLRYAVDRYIAEYRSSFGRDPSDDKICSHFRITPERLLFLRNNGTGPMRLDPPKKSDEEFTLADTVASSEDPETIVLDRIEREEVRRILRGFVDELPADQRRAVSLFYLSGYSDKTCSAEMDMTVSKFRALRLAGVKNLRRRKNLELLGRYLPERVGSMAFHRANRNHWQSSTEAAAFKSIYTN